MPRASYPALIRDLLEQGWLIVETRRGRMVDHATYSSSESLVLAATPTAVRTLARQQPKSDTEAVGIRDVQLLGQLTVAPGLADEQ